MATTLDYSGATFRVNIPQADLTMISASLFELDTDVLFNDLKSLEAAEDGIAFQDMQQHNSEYTIAGVTYAQSLEILNASNSSNVDLFEIFFNPDTTYSVRLIGSNNNVFDLQNAILANAVTQVIPNNSAGLIVVTSGSGVTAGDILAIAAAVWNALTASHILAGSFGLLMSKLLTIGKWLGLRGGPGK